MELRAGIAALLLSALLVITSACAKRTAATDDASTHAPLRVLFVGNSLTYYNDLPAKFAALRAASLPQGAVHTEMLAQGGASLRDRLQDGSLPRVLSAGDFDVVILQDFGAWPLCSTEIPACEADSQSLREAVTLVRNHGARPVWFATWLPPAMQPVLSRASAEVATEVGVEWVDVGGALRNASSSTTALLHEDGHPTPQGSWLAAMALLRQVQPRLQLQTRSELTACGHTWQGSDLRGDTPASRQGGRIEQCDHLDAASLQALSKTLD